MEQSTFLISDYISQNQQSNIDDLRENLFKKGILSKDYEDENLVLLYNRYENKKKNDMERECRSVILDRTSLDIVCYTCNTPITNITAINYIMKQSENMNIYNCYEGTLLSLFYHTDKWYLSSRRCLDSKNSILNEKSHYDMFIEVLNQDNIISLDEFTKELNKDYCYYFVLIHHNNMNLCDYSEKFGENYKKNCLAFVRNKENQKEVDIENLKLDFLSENIFLPEKLDDLSSFDQDNKNYNFESSPKSEGVVIKVKENDNYKLLKLQTLSYQFHKAIGPKKNIFKGLIHLYQENKLKEYFNTNVNFDSFKKIVNPTNTSESYDTIGIIDALFKVLTSEIFSLFKLMWNLKTNQHMNGELYKILPKEYKTVLFGLRGVYFKLKSKDPSYYLKISNVYNYLKSIDSDNIEKLLRSRKLMFNLMKTVNDEKIKIFNNISFRCDKVHLKLTAIYTNILFPEIMPDDIPKLS